MNCTCFYIFYIDTHCQAVGVCKLKAGIRMALKGADVTVLRAQGWVPIEGGDPWHNWAPPNEVVPIYQQMHSFIHGTHRTDGINKLWKRICYLRSLTLMNSMFTFTQAAKIRQPFQVHIRKETASGSSLWALAATIMTPTLPFQACMPWGSLLFTTSSYRLLSASGSPICFLVLLGKKKNKQNYIMGWSIFTSPCLSSCRIIHPRKGLRKME